MHLSVLLILAIAVQGGATDSVETASNPQVALETSKGRIVLELYADKAPATVENFLDYVDGEFYGDTIFHRVIKGFMIQGGGFESGMKKKSTRPPVKNESDNGVSNARGTIAMARTADPHSATAQFFINTVNNSRSLDHGGNIEVSGSGWGYTVFGKVIEGMEVVDAISDVPTGRSGPFGDVPLEDVVILSASRVE